MKFAFGKAVILGLALAGATFAGCSSDHAKTSSGSVSNENTGDLGLQLTVGDLSVNTVAYNLTNGTNTYTGNIDVSDSSTLTAVIGGVIQSPPNYTLTLTATATDGASQCTGSATGIAVTANQTATAAVTLRCTKPRNKGQVLVNGSTNECPDVTAVLADGAQGCSVGLHVQANDGDSAPAALSYTWTGGGLTIGANPVLDCQASGKVDLSVKVSDGDATCDETVSLSVICPTGCPLVAPTCTDTKKNQDETDVDCGGTHCGPCALGKSCLVKADCAGTTVCDATLHCAAAPTCTDGIKNGNETGVDCGGSCPACPSLTAQALAAHSAACLACAQSKALCNNLLVNQSCDLLSGNASGGPSSGTAKSTLCLNLLNKELSTKCAASADGASVCYCGTSGADCFSVTNAANGGARPEEEAALESTAPATIGANFGDSSLAGGIANNLMQCLNDNGCNSCF